MGKKSILETNLEIKNTPQRNTGSVRGVERALGSPSTLGRDGFRVGANKQEVHHDTDNQKECDWLGCVCKSPSWYCGDSAHTRDKDYCPGQLIFSARIFPCRCECWDGTEKG